MSPGRCATARRAGWRCTQETGTPRRRAVPLFSALARFQKTRSASLEAHAPLGSQPPWAILVAASRHTSYNPAFFCQAQRWWIGRSRQPQNKSQNKRAALLQTQKLLHPILHGPAQVDKDATDGVSAGHLRRFGAAAREKCATAIARREAGTVRRPSTRTHDNPLRHRRNNMKRRAATPTARPARPSTRRRRSRTPTIRWTRS